MKKIILSILLLCLTLPVLSMAKQVYDEPSKLGSSARHIALGNVDGFSEGADSVFENPAALHRINNYVINLFSSSILWDIDYNNIAFAKKMPSYSVGIGYYELVDSNHSYTPRYANSDKNNLNNHKWADHNNGGANYINSQGNFDIKTSVLKLAYQRSLDNNLHYGINTSIHQFNHIESKGRGFDIDLGLIKNYRYGTLSASVKNLFGNSVSITNTFQDNTPSEKIKVPLQREVVISGRVWAKKIHVLPQIAYTQKKLLPSLGLAYNIPTFPALTLYAGHKSSVESEQVKRRLSMGLGYKIQNIGIYYAFNKGDALNHENQQYVSLEVTL